MAKNGDPRHGVADGEAVNASGTKPRRECSNNRRSKQGCHAGDAAGAKAGLPSIAQTGETTAWQASVCDSGSLSLQQEGIGF